MSWFRGVHGKTIIKFYGYIDEGQTRRTYSFYKALQNNKKATGKMKQNIFSVKSHSIIWQFKFCNR